MGAQATRLGLGRGYRHAQWAVGANHSLPSPPPSALTPARLPAGNEPLLNAPRAQDVWGMGLVFAEMVCGPALTFLLNNQPGCVVGWVAAGRLQAKLVALGASQEAAAVAADLLCPCPDQRAGLDLVAVAERAAAAVLTPQPVVMGVFVSASDTGGGRVVRWRFVCEVPYPHREGPAGNLGP